MILHETSVSYIIQQLRVLNAACKETRTDEEWKKLQDTHSLIAFEDLNSEVDEAEVNNYAAHEQKRSNRIQDNNEVLIK